MIVARPPGSSSPDNVTITRGIACGFVSNVATLPAMRPLPVAGVEARSRVCRAETAVAPAGPSVAPMHIASRNDSGRVT